MTTTATPPRERVRRGGGGGSGDAWRVIVLNDNHNTFEGVAFALAQTIPGIDYDKGLRLASTIHASGQAVVWSGHREAAELYHAQLEGYGDINCAVDVRVTVWESDGISATNTRQVVSGHASDGYNVCSAETG